MRKIRFSLSGIVILSGILGLMLMVALSPKENHSISPETGGNLRVAVVGDTGIGERAFHKGFVAVQKAIRKKQPDVLLHLGDFVYQPKSKPKSCPDKYIREIRKTLVEPFPYRLFVPGDNDLPHTKEKPQASGCWSEIDPLDTPFDEINDGDKDPSFFKNFFNVLFNSHKGPAAFEGTKVIGNTFFALLNVYPWKDPTDWLGPRVKEARKKGLWVILLVHEPPITTAWYLDKRQTVLKQLNALQPDLVFSGNQHSYERFHPMGGPSGEEILPKRQPTSPSKYKRGEGTIYIVSGGGGAHLKPFADQRKEKKYTAPPEVFEALATRAIMNHFIILDISAQALKGTTYRVCAKKAHDKDTEDLLWKDDKKLWKDISLECKKKSKQVAKFDHFEISR